MSIIIIAVSTLISTDTLVVEQMYSHLCTTKKLKHNTNTKVGSACAHVQNADRADAQGVVTV